LLLEDKVKVGAKNLENTFKGECKKNFNALFYDEFVHKRLLGTVWKKRIVGSIERRDLEN
jgi:hypothetical protein